MFRFIKCFFYGFILVLLWQIAQISDSSCEHIDGITLRLSDDFEKSAHNMIKLGEKNISDMQQNLADYVKRTSQQYIGN